MKPVAHFFTSSGRLATAARGSSLLVAESRQTNSAVNSTSRTFRMSFTGGGTRDHVKELFQAMRCRSCSGRWRPCTATTTSTMQQRQRSARHRALACPRPQMPCSRHAPGPLARRYHHEDPHREPSRGAPGTSWLPLACTLTQVLLILNQRVGVAIGTRRQCPLCLCR